MSEQNVNLDAITSRSPIKSVAEFMDLCESLEGKIFFPEEGSIPVEKSSKWAYRGQPRTFGSLKPSFQRQFQRQSVSAAEHIECRLIKAFRQHYENLRDRRVSR
jgi:hypothetical protein